MRPFHYLFAFCFILSPACIRGQAQNSSPDPVLTQSRGGFGHIYRLNNKNAVELYKKANTRDQYSLRYRAFMAELAGELLSQTPIDTFHGDFPTRALPVGHYALVRAMEEQLRVELHAVNQLQVQVIEHPNAFEVQVSDSTGRLISDARVRLGNTLAKYDPRTQTYRIPGRRTGGFLEVSSGDESLFTTILEVSGSKYPARWWRYHRNYGLCKVADWPIEKIRIPLRQLRYRRHHYRRLQLQEYREYKYLRRHRFKGYIALNQPKYMPGDTLHMKAYITNRRGKPIRKALTVSLNESGNGRSALEQQLKPASAGVFLWDIVLADSLVLDQSYYVSVAGKPSRRFEDAKPALSQGFYFEDYQLDVVNYTAKPNKTTYTAQDTVRIHLKATDANDHPVPEVQATVLLLATGSSDFQADDVWVPDTLWRAVRPLGERGTLRVDVPGHIWPNCNVEVNMAVFFVNNAGEQQEVTQTFRRQASFAQPKLTLKDSLGCFWAYWDNLHNLPTPAAGDSAVLSRCWPGGRVVQQKIALPYHDSLWHTLNFIRISAAGQRAGLSPERASVKLFVSNTQDTTYITALNPKGLSVHFQVMTDKGVVVEATSAAPKWRWKSAAYSQKSIFVTATYVSGGSQYTTRADLPYNSNELYIESDQLAEIQPGASVQIKIQTKDKKQRPIQGVNLVAGAFNQQFNSDAPFSGPFVRVKSQRSIFWRARFELNPLSNIKATLPISTGWYAQLRLERIVFYRLRYQCTQNQNLYLESFPLPLDSTAMDTLPQIAPFVIENNKAVPIYLIYLNHRLVYYHGAEEQAYSFLAKKGSNNLQIRTKTRQYTLENIVLESNKKYELAIHANIYGLAEASGQSLKIKQIAMPDTLIQQEKTLLNNTILRWRVGQRSDMPAYFWQPRGQIYAVKQPLSHSTLLIGPFDPYRSITCLRPAAFVSTFRFEPGFEYEIEENHERLYATKWPSGRKLPLALPLQLPGEQVLRKEQLQMPVTKRFEPFFFAPRTGKNQATGKMLVEAPARNMEILLLSIRQGKDDSVVAAFAPNQFRRIVGLPPGIYRLSLYDSEGKAATREVVIKRDSLHFVRIGDRDFQVPPPEKILEKVLEPLRGLNSKALSDAPSTFSQWPDADANSWLTGTVTDDSGEVLIGATVVVSQAGVLIRGAITDVNGYYRVPVVPGVYTIEVRYTGYTIQQLTGVVALSHKINNNDMSMFASHSLSEVAVIAYSVPLIRQDNTSSAQIRSLPTRSINAIQALDGGLAGLEVADGVKIRGSRGSMLDYYLDSIRISDLDVLELSQNNLAGNLPAFGSGTVRSDFKDYAYWQPNLVTDKNGFAVFNVTFPDNLTNWSTFIVGMGKRNRAGVAKQQTKAFKPLTAQLSLPRFALAGDQIEVAGLVSNLSDDSMRVNTRFLQNGRVIQQKETRIGAALAEFVSVTVPASGSDSLHIRYELHGATAQDGEARSIAVQLPGTQKTQGDDWMLQDTQLVWNARQPGIPVRLYLQNSSIEVLKEELRYLIEYPYGCNEQTASRLTALLLAQKLQARTTEPLFGSALDAAALKKQITACVQGLRKAQHPDGTWGWWPEGPANTWMTTYVLGALTEAKTAGYETEALQHGLVWLRTNLPAMRPSEQQHALDALRRAGVNIDCTPYLKAPKSDASGAEQLAYLRLRQRCGQMVSKDSLALLLWNNPPAELSAEAPPLRNRFYERPENNYLLGYDIAQAAGWQDIQMEIRQYWFKSRANKSRSTFEKARILYHLVESLPATQPVGQMPDVWVNGRRIAQLPASLSFDPQQLADAGGLQIHCKGGPVFAGAYQQWHDEEPLADSKNFLVESFFVQEKRRLQDAETVQRGVAAELVVRVRAHQSSEYVMVEVPVPAGCAYGEKIQKGTGVETHRSYFRDRVAIFCEQLPKGDYEFRIPLEPRFRGQYIMNPAKAEEMYFPTIYGQKGMGKVGVR